MLNILTPRCPSGPGKISDRSDSGFGGAEVACWPLIPKYAGFLKGDKKILSTHSFGREVKLSVPCRRRAACKRTLDAYPRHHLATISHP